MTQDELDAVAAKEAEELLLKHRTVVALTPEQIAALEHEKATMLSRVGLNHDPDSGPRARRLAGRGAGGADAEPYEPPVEAAPKPEWRPAPQEMLSGTKFIVEVPAGQQNVDLDKVDPIQLAELAEDTKSKRKRYLALKDETDKAQAEYQAAEGAFLAYLRQ